MSFDNIEGLSENQIIQLYDSVVMKDYTNITAKVWSCSYYLRCCDGNSRSSYAPYYSEQNSSPDGYYIVYTRYAAGSAAYFCSPCSGTDVQAYWYNWGCH